MDQVSYRCAEVEIDAHNRRLSRRGVEIPVEPRVFAVLLQLVARPGDLVTRDALLDAVWGHRFVTPSTLNRVIGLARRAFDPASDGTAYIQTVHGAGYRYIGPIEVRHAESREVRARFAPPPAVRLPARLQTLIGRNRELRQMEDLLADSRALTILGSGGMGKTQCALSYARQASGQYPDGVWFFDLVPTRQPEDWLRALAAALSITVLTRQEQVEGVSRALAGRRALLVLDNCDHVASGVGELVHEILRATDELKILATSQQLLNFIGERVLRLPPLDLPPWRPSGDSELREVAAAPAVTLLLVRIQAVQPGFELTAANAPTIVEICERLDGMPLALELAAARFALLSPEQVLERLEHRFRFLASDVAGRDERHRNLMALLDWSYGLLSDEEQRFLAWLGVFVQGWTVDAATELASALGHGPELAVDLLTGLVNKSLVTVDQTVTPPRYRLLESLREFALAQLATIGEEQRARDAQLAFVHRMTGEAHRDMLRGQMRDRMAMLMREHGNIEGAITHAIATPGSRRAALGIVGALVLYTKSQSEFGFAKELCQRSLAAAETPTTAEHGRAWLCLGVIGMHMKAPDLNPVEALGHAMRIARETGDQWTEAYASANHALVLIERGRVDDVTGDISLVERAAEQMGDALLQGLAALARAWRSFAQGAPAQALAELEAVRDLGPDVHQRQFIELYIGLALFGLDDHAAAAGSWYSAMGNALVPPRNARVIAATLEGCGYLAVHFGKVDDAARFLGAAARIREQRMAPLLRFWIAHHEHALATLRSAMGRSGFDAAFVSGGQAREEDVVNEAAARLREFQKIENIGPGTIVTSAHRATRSPAEQS